MTHAPQAPTRLWASTSRPTGGWLAGGGARFWIQTAEHPHTFIATAASMHHATHGAQLMVQGAPSGRRVFLHCRHHEQAATFGCVCVGEARWAVVPVTVLCAHVVGLPQVPSLPHLHPRAGQRVQDLQGIAPAQGRLEHRVCQLRPRRDGGHRLLQGGAATGVRYMRCMQYTRLHCPHPHGSVQLPMPVPRGCSHGAGAFTVLIHGCLPAPMLSPGPLPCRRCRG